MKASTVWSLASDGRLRTLGAIALMARPFYAGCFLVAAARNGTLRLLGSGPASLALLAAELGVGAGELDALQDWLAVGTGAGVLERDASGYVLKSRLARVLATQDDAALAMLEEIVTMHHDLILRAPGLMRSGGRLTLSDQDGEVVARSSRVLEPIVQEAIDWVVSPDGGATRLLEVGCGSGTHIHHAALRNPSLRARGLELQPAVAELARKNLEGWGLASRVEVRVGDVRGETSEPAWDLVTLHNNIYYFPVRERVALFRHLRGFLVEGGRFLATTACRGGSAAGSVLSLWGSLTEGCGRLPAPEELCEQMREAGFVGVESRSLLGSVESFHAFTGRR